MQVEVREWLEEADTLLLPYESQWLNSGHQDWIPPAESSCCLQRWFKQNIVLQHKLLWMTLNTMWLESLWRRKTPWLKHGKRMSWDQRGKDGAGAFKPMHSRITKHTRGWRPLKCPEELTPCLLGSFASVWLNLHLHIYLKCKWHHVCMGLCLWVLLSSNLSKCFNCFIPFKCDFWLILWKFHVFIQRVWNIFSHTPSRLHTALQSPQLPVLFFLVTYLF